MFRFVSGCNSIIFTSNGIDVSSENESEESSSNRNENQLEIEGRKKEEMENDMKDFQQFHDGFEIKNKFRLGI